VAPTLGPTRTEADFVAHIQQTVETDPFAGWIFITDNLNTHQSESQVRYAAQACGIEEDLGEKGKRGRGSRGEGGSVTQGGISGGITPSTRRGRR
jgi:hypothetical protein